MSTSCKIRRVAASPFFVVAVLSLLITDFLVGTHYIDAIGKAGAKGCM